MAPSGVAGRPPVHRICLIYAPQCASEAVETAYPPTGNRGGTHQDECCSTTFPGAESPGVCTRKNGVCMSRSLTILLRRDPSRYRWREHVHYEGYQILWPDGRPVAVGLDAFCRHGQRLLGLGRYLAGCPERLIRVLFFPLQGKEDDL